MIIRKNRIGIICPATIFADILQIYIVGCSGCEAYFLQRYRGKHYIIQSYYITKLTHRFKAYEQCLTCVSIKINDLFFPAWQCKCGVIPLVALDAVPCCACIGTYCYIQTIKIG